MTADSRRVPPPPPLTSFPGAAYSAGATISATWDDASRLYAYRIETAATKRGTE